MPLSTPTAPQAPDPQARDFAVVVVCWNNKRYLEPCLESLYNAGIRHRFEVVVVDNGSTDGSQAMVQSRFPQVLLVQNEQNVGLSRAANQGIRNSSSAYVLLLNDDTLVNGPSLDGMCDFMDSCPQAAAVGGNLLNPDGSFQAGYGSYSSLPQEFLIATGLSRLISPAYPSHGSGESVVETDWLSSACLMLRRQAIDEVGLLREDYFIYGDETDLQFRLTKAGWKVYYLPKVTTIHFGGRSLDRWKRRKMVYRGKLLFYRRNFGRIRTSALQAMIAGLTILKLGVWGTLIALPWWNARAKREFRSNIDVLAVCWRLP